jgi:hypothetical protein
VGSVVVGAIYALVDGLIGGAILGWLYNLIVGEVNRYWPKAGLG